MIKYHVDSHDCLQIYANEKYQEFVGKVSVCISGKPIIIFGQDESLYNQFSFGSSKWVGAYVER